jgi:DNA-binding GntR family transcriptional regulator
MEARALIEPPAAGMVAGRTDRVRSARALRTYVAEHDFAPEDPRFDDTFFEFNRLLVSLTGNETLTLVTAMLEMISEAATLVLDREMPSEARLALHRKVKRARLRLADHVEAGQKDEAEALWRVHLLEAGKQIAAGRASKVVDVLS